MLVRSGTIEGVRARHLRRLARVRHLGDSSAASPVSRNQAPGCVSLIQSGEARAAKRKVEGVAHFRALADTITGHQGGVGQGMRYLLLALLFVIPVLAGADAGVGEEAWVPDDDAEILGYVEQGLTCRKGCRCGNACISCDKQCHKGSSGGCSTAGF